LKKLSLRLKFLLLLFCLLIITFGITALIITHQENKRLKQNLVNESKSFTALATQPIGNVFETYHDSGNLKIKQEVEAVTSLDEDIDQVEIIDSSNQRLFTDSPDNAIDVPKSAVTSLEPTFLYAPNGDLTAIVHPYIENYGIHKYNMVYGVSYDSVDRSIKTIFLSILYLTIIILLLTLVIGYFLIDRLFLLPVLIISRLSLKISSGDLNQQIRLKREDEIGRLAKAVDTMAGSLKEDIKKLQKLDEMKNEFLMITSHNLRTPITVIAGYLEMIEEVADDKVKMMTEPIQASLNRLKAFTEDAIAISSIELGHNAIELKPVDAAPLLLAMAGEFAVQARQKSIDFRIDIRTHGKVDLSIPYFRNALWNLLDNAYKFTPENGQITLSAEDNGRELLISVIDNGPGIKASEIDHLFTKFHRGTPLLEYNYEGTGIGLYISKLIINQLNGTISVDSTEGAGSRFTITLPMVQK
jgi:signal transduction histidine kinase